jgi:acetyl-CoA C-acetyltransferase
MRPIAILSAKRTPIGAFQGSLKSFSAVQLGSAAIKAALDSSGLENDAIDEVIMGCVLPGALGQSPARQALINAGLNKKTGALTVNKVCGSGMKAVMMGCDQIRSGSAKAVIAGGMESMSNTPYMLTKGRDGYRMGHNCVYDHMMMDGLEDAYDRGKPMGVFAENTVSKFNFTREDQDDFAAKSAKKALLAQENKWFNDEILELELQAKAGTQTINTDEPPLKVKFDKMRSLKPAFKECGTVTAANSSSISDGAAAIALMDFDEAQKNGVKPIAKVVAYTSFAHEPEWFTTAPIGAIEKVLQMSGWKKEDVDLFEINEAFAVVAMATMQEMSIDHDKVNVHGGACALGHPIGASGARIITTLVHALKNHNKQRGIAALCIGGGEATAMAIEVVA